MAERESERSRICDVEGSAGEKSIESSYKIQ
jgi:hypothetical protein